MITVNWIKLTLDRWHYFSMIICPGCCCSLESEYEIVEEHYVLLEIKISLLTKKYLVAKYTLLTVYSQYGSYLKCLWLGRKKRPMLRKIKSHLHTRQLVLQTSVSDKTRQKMIYVALSCYKSYHVCNIPTLTCRLLPRVRTYS